MRGFSGLSDFFLRKAFKFALKRNLGKYLASELDPNQLDVQLGQGTIELRQLLLNCNELNEQLNSPYWEITAGFIGSVKATVPITTLSTDRCQAKLDEVLITIKPKSLHHPSVHGTAAGISLLASNIFAQDEEDQKPAQDIMTEGIMLIAGGIESVVQQLQLQVTRATVRVELPSVSTSSGPPSLIMLHVDSISYSGDSSTALDAAVSFTTALTLCKKIRFEGLQVELFQDIDDPVAAAEGQNVMSQMRSAELQLVTDLEANVPDTLGEASFEREAVTIQAQDEFESSSVETYDNRHVIICSSNGLGCSGQIAISLTWQQPQQIHPRIAVHLDLNPLQLQLHPHHLPLLSKVADCLKDSSQQAQHVQHDSPGLAGSSIARQQEAGFVAGARNYVESALLPNCERLAQDVVGALSWNSGANPVPANSVTDLAGTAQRLPADDAGFWGLNSNSNLHSTAFHDAHSMMDSVGTTFNSFLSTTAVSLGSSQHGVPSSSSAHQQPGQSQRAQSQGEVPTARLGMPSSHAVNLQEGPLGWEVRAQCSEASLVLWYPEEEEQDPDQDLMPFSCDYRPRFCMETGDLELRVTAANDAALQCNLSLYRLECAEHLPVSGQEAAPAAATLAEVIRIPDLLPPSVPGSRPVPSFSGVSPLPVTHSLYSSTLSQLATSVCGGSSMEMRKFATSVAQVQVWPVLCAGSGLRKAAGITPSATLSMHINPPTPPTPPSGFPPSHGPSGATSRPSSGGSATPSSGRTATAVASVKLRPSTVWLSLPLLQRLQAFLAPLSNLPVVSTQQSSEQQQEHGVSLPFSGTGFDSILEDLQEIQDSALNSASKAQKQSGLHVSVQTPHICALILLPPPPADSSSAVACHGNSYMAVDLFAAAAVRDTQLDKPSLEAMLTLKTVPQKPSRPLGATRRGQKNVPDVWEGDLAVGRAKMYLVGNPFAEAGAPGGIADPHLQAHCILDVMSHAESLNSSLPSSGHSALSSHMALSANVRVTPGVKTQASLIDLAWEGGQNHSGTTQGGRRGTHTHLDSVHLQEAVIAASSITVHLKAPNLDAQLCQADLAAVLHLVAALNAWQAESQLASAAQQAESDVGIVPLQTSVLLECGMTAKLQHIPQAAEGARDTECILKAEDVRIFNVSSLGGVMDAGALSTHAEGVTLTGGQDRGCLLHCPTSSLSSSSSQSTSAMELWQVTRPIPLETSRLVNPKPGQPATLANSEGIASLLINGATFATDAGDLTLPWLTDLANFFITGIAGGYQGGTETVTPTPPAMTWSVALQDVAVRYEPKDLNSARTQQAQQAAVTDSRSQHSGKLVSAILTLAGLQWCMQPGDEDQRVLLQCLGLYCADSTSRKGDWKVSHPQHVPAMQLPESGYSLVAQEFQLEIALKPPNAAGSEFSQTEISNQRLSSSLSKRQLRLLILLMSQWTGNRSQPSVNGRDESGSAGSSRQAADQHCDPAFYLGQTDSGSGTVEWQGVSGEGQLRVMDGVEEDAFRTADQLGKQQTLPEASVFLEGGWFPPKQPDMLDIASSIIEVDPRIDQASPSGSAPDVSEDYVYHSLPPSEASEEWEADPSSEERGVWYGNPSISGRDSPSLEDNYIQLQPPSRQGVHGAPTGRGAIGPLPPSHPIPLSRLIFRDLKLLLTLNQEEDKRPSQPGHVQQAEPNNGRMELDLEGVSLQMDTFKPQGSPYVWRLAFSIHQLEVRDHVKKSGGKPPRWRRMLGFHFMPRTPRDPAAVMLQVELEAVRPDGTGQEDEEYRLSAALLPLRLRIDQNMVTFLQDFFAASGEDRGTQEKPNAEEGSLAMATDQQLEGLGVFLQKVDIQPFIVVIDYQPRRLDAAALRAGSFVEVLNLVPWGGVQLDLPGVKASGLQGWSAFGSAVGNAYLQDIASSQVHKFVVGVAPVRSLCRVGWAAKQLLSIPADQLRNTSISNAGSRRSGSGEVALTRQLRRGVTSLARAITLEALGLGASVAGGADFVLRGGSAGGSEHPAGLKEGLKQAAQGLSSGLETAASALVYSPVRSLQDGDGVGQAVARAIRNVPGALAAPAAAAAAATRVTFLGMRNALDPERYEERRR